MNDEFVRRCRVPGGVAALGILLAGLNQTAWADAAQTLSEKDFLSEMPIVLTVSRLPQRLDETPGAVTLIDRDTIRRSGARDVADLLRLVPGFQVSNAFESVAPLASYHGAFGSFSNRLELLIDGRSVYSPYFIGSIGPGLQTVALQDIERIEVLRGSNSATYGARAILGVINIVTRHSADTVGGEVALTGGSNGVDDAYARIGWGDDRATFRLSADSRADDGLDGAIGTNQVRRVNLRADLNPVAGDELQLRLGGMDIDAGKGRIGRIEDPPRDSYFSTGYAQIDWRRSLGVDSELAFKLSHNQEHYSDHFPYDLKVFGLPGTYTVSGDGRASIDVVSLQHSWRQSPALRMVWGAEYRSERVNSPALYATEADFVTDFTRLFGNLEWRLAPAWVLNAGAMLEHSSVTGDDVAPRVMLNWHAAEGQTWRVGFSEAIRPPSTYEKFAKLIYSLPYGLERKHTIASGLVDNERVYSREIGYLGEFPGWRLSLDARLFHEQIEGFIRQLNDTEPRDYANDESFPLYGLEYQLNWKPWSGAQLGLNQAIIRNGASPDNGTRSYRSTPSLATTLSYSQKLPNGLDLTLLHQDSWTATLMGTGDYFAIRRTDLRLGWPLRWGARTGELALTLQALGGGYRDYKSWSEFPRRAYLTLRLEQ